jgi:hypothetical protein
MVNREWSTDRRKPTLVPVIAQKQAWTGLTRRATTRGVASPARRLDRVSIGFWLGGVTFGAGGCILGACMASHHPIATAISAMWWGVYLGGLGASLGALLALFTHRAPAPAQTEAVDPRRRDTARELHS